MTKKRILMSGAGSGFGELAATSLAKAGHDTIAALKSGLR
jgi:NADP-dependent 3-hydroxy acid dehydrogenase YdfG